MLSKMECLNLAPFCSENLAQGSPKTLQDAPKTPKTGQGPSQTSPRRPQVLAILSGYAFWRSFVAILSGYPLWLSFLGYPLHISFGCTNDT